MWYIPWLILQVWWIGMCVWAAVGVAATAVLMSAWGFAVTDHVEGSRIIKAAKKRAHASILITSCAPLWPFMILVMIGISRKEVFSDGNSLTHQDRKALKKERSRIALEKAIQDAEREAGIR